MVRHIVGWGESFDYIARKYGVTLDEIYRPKEDKPVNRDGGLYLSEVLEIYAASTGPAYEYIIEEEPV